MLGVLLGPVLPAAEAERRQGGAYEGDDAGDQAAEWTPFMYAVWLPSTAAALSWAGIASETEAKAHRD
ncbi:hypothetical protein [Streptomyces canus]|uniref:hypothetical protein n=1 Tax=Streptomyces canus TaxID=58343 RepID=UPI00324B8AAE